MLPVPALRSKPQHPAVSSLPGCCHLPSAAIQRKVERVRLKSPLVPGYTGDFTGWLSFKCQRDQWHYVAIHLMLEHVGTVGMVLNPFWLDLQSTAVSGSIVEPRKPCCEELRGLVVQHETHWLIDNCWPTVSHISGLLLDDQPQLLPQWYVNIYVYIIYIHIIYIYIYMCVCVCIYNYIYIYTIYIKYIYIHFTHTHIYIYIYRFELYRYIVCIIHM